MNASGVVSRAAYDGKMLGLRHFGMQEHKACAHPHVPVHVNVAILAVIADLSVSANLLTWFGVPYVAPGGCLLLKIHPGSYVAALACLTRLISFRPGENAAWRIFWKQPGPIVFLTCIGFCAVEAMLMTGQGNVIVLLDTFMPAGWLALAFCDASPASLGRVCRVLQTLLAVNVVLALAETLMHAHVVPLYLDGAPYVARDAEFRPTALYDHPLTGAAMTMIGILMPPGSRRTPRLRALYLALMLSGLVAFGGRMAIVATTIAFAIWYVPPAIGSVLRRRVCAFRCIIVASVAASTLVAIGFAVVFLGVGERLMGHLYWDPSAQVRLRQWMILGSLDVRQWLFGCQRDDLFSLVNSLRLSYGVEVIENFWLLMFLSLGAFGFPFFCAGLYWLLVWCGRRGGTSLAMVAGFLLVASSSNSLGRKSPLLAVLVAATTTSFRQSRSPRSPKVALVHVPPSAGRCDINLKPAGGAGQCKSLA